jgi:alpha-L-rhamnosidase
VTEPALPPTWTASWIWHGAEGVPVGDPLGAMRAAKGERDVYCLFRGSVDLDVAPSSALLRAAGSSRFRLYVNGRRVARGPIRSSPAQQPGELVDVGRLLVAGANTVTALVRYYGEPTSWWIPAPVTAGLAGGCFAAELVVDGVPALGTDDRWLSQKSPAWTASERDTALSGFLPEDLDVAALPAGWPECPEVDGSWSAATVLDQPALGSGGRVRPPAGPFGPLRPRPLAQLAGERRTPLKVGDHPLGPDGELLLSAGRHVVDADFGETVSGEVVLDVDGVARTVIQVDIGEEVGADGRLLAAFAHHTLRFASPGSALFESFESVGGRYAELTIDAEAPVTVTFSVAEKLFPRGEVASFRCSDPLLDEVFDVGLRTVDLCSQDAYIDGPTREQRSWVGDAVVHQSVHLATASDWSLARWHAEMSDAPRPDGMLTMTVASNLGGSPEAATFIPDWALHWVRGLHNLMRYTGDLELVSRHLPTAERVLRWFQTYQRGDGLLSHLDGAVLVDWSNLPLADTSAVVNALWARGLRDFEQLADWVGDAGRARWAATQRQAVAKGFEAFWDDERGAYRDQRIGGVVPQRFSRHANAAAICAALVPSHRVDSVVALLLDRASLVDDAPVPAALAAGDLARNAELLTRGNPEPTWDTSTMVLEAQPFFRYVVHDALVEAGHADALADLCRDWKVFLDAGERTWPEAWVGGTHCHGWSATPTRDLITSVLGLTPDAFGFASAALTPALGDLEWIRARVPLPQGWISVEVDRHALSVDSPVPVVWHYGGRHGSWPVGRHRVEASA